MKVDLMKREITGRAEPLMKVIARILGPTKNIGEGIQIMVRIRPELVAMISIIKKTGQTEKDPELALKEIKLIKTKTTQETIKADHHGTR